METIFQNTQWVVTERGMQSRHHVPTYTIPADQLLQASHGHYYWPEHMAEKMWVMTPEFIAAYVAALDALHPEYDKASLDEAIATALRIKAD
jgi:hypothetical protein